MISTITWILKAEQLTDQYVSEGFTVTIPNQQYGNIHFIY